MGSITVEPKELANALTAVKPAVNTRSGIEALAGVRISNSVAGPRMFASDRDTSVMRSFAGEQDGDINVVVPHAAMVKVAKAFDGRDSILLEPVPAQPGGPATMYDRLMCSNGSRSIQVAVNRLEDFPPFSNYGGVQLVDANASELRACILRADKFRSHDDTRPILTGMHVSSSVLCVTDSYRLVVGKVPGWLPNLEHEVTFSGNGLALAAAKMPKDDTRVSVFSADEHSWVVWPGTVWCSRNIDGQYPNYKQLLPDADKWEGAVTAPTANLLAGAKLATQFCTKNAPVRVTLNGNCKMSGETPDASSFEEIIDGATIAKPSNETGDFTIGLNPEFLAQSLSELGSENARFRVISPLRPLKIENCDNDDEWHLLMPIRLNV